nr:uncharacterized protein LOC113814634 [Penaeus vannamei]
MVCLCCCCDPHKLAYISGIITAIEAVAFAVLNAVLICMNKCIIKPPDALTGQISDFWSWYFYDDAAETCSNVSITANYHHRPSLTDYIRGEFQVSDRILGSPCAVVRLLLRYDLCLALVTSKRWGYVLGFS